MTGRPSAPHARHPLWGLCVFALIALVGLYYVKWSPYYDRIFVAEQTRSIGGSILNGSDGMLPAPSLQAALDYALAYGRAIWKALILGLLLGSALQALLPPRWIRRWLGGSGAGSVLTGSLLSIPSMMCTCCSAPVVNGLRQCRAAPGATAAYWLGNTMLNPATLVFMGFVLGWQWAGLRLAAGLAMVLGLGWLVNRLNRSSAPLASTPAGMDTDACDADAPMDVHSMLRRWARAFTGMALRLLPEYLILVLLLGAARAWLFPVLDMSIDNSLLWIAGAAIAGLLFVIPTAGEVPIVQAMLALGVAAGPAAALLVTLPPVSLPSLAMVAKSFRRADLAVMIAGIVFLGMLAGGAAVLLGF
ncbi:permease [uncultured Castellaniella sp.]|uniref:permease n=1 Tax=uncultured Castellaniella sp. TaxID=647907 RepID=UPI00261FE6FD|nr:permease [uncultured Castellaniella sp.]